MRWPSGYKITCDYIDCPDSRGVVHEDTIPAGWLRWKLSNSDVDVISEIDLCPRHAIGSAIRLNSGREGVED